MFNSRLMYVYMKTMYVYDLTKIKFCGIIRISREVTEIESTYGQPPVQDRPTVGENGLSAAPTCAKRENVD